MKPKLILTCLTGLLLQLAGRAQTYTRGSIELQNGETKQGWIYYEPWIKAPKKIRFSADSLNHTIYRAAEIKLLDIPGYDRYRTALIKMRKEGPGIRDVQDSLVMDTALLSVLLDGSYFSLYELDDDSMRYFIRPNGREVMELDRKEFQRQLATYHPEDFDETRAYFEYLEKIKFTEEDLLAAAQKINEKHAGGKVLYTLNSNNHVRPKGNWFLGGGGGIATTKKVSQVNSFSAVTGMGKGSALYLTGGKDIPVTRNIYGLFFRLELEFSTFDYSASRDKVLQADRVDYAANGFSVTPGVSLFTYLFHSNKSGAYIGAGTHYHLTFYNQNQLDAYFSNYALHSDIDVRADKFWVNASLQLGYIYHKQWELTTWVYPIGHALPNIDARFFAVGLYYHLKTPH